MILYTTIIRSNDSMVLVSSSARQFDNMDDSGEIKENVKEIAHSIMSPTPAKMRINAGRVAINYEIFDGVIVLVATDKSYPERLTFLYMENLFQRFVRFLQANHRDDWKNAIAVSDRPFCYIRFDRDIQRFADDYSDPTSTDNSARLREKVNSIHDVMKKNIEDILDRETNLNEAAAISDKLRAGSKSFVWGSKRLNYEAMLRMYAPCFGILAVLLIIILYKLFL